MARAKRSRTPIVYQIKVTLKGSKSPIWRRMQVTSGTTLAQLHQILQCVMGWEGYHLYRFEVSGMEYGDPRMLEEMEGEDARKVTLEALVQGAKDKFLYEYDFGDSWDHELLVEKVLPYEAGKPTRCALQANAPVHPRIVVVSGGTRAFWRLYKTRSTPSMRRWWTGSVAHLIQRPLIWTRSTASSKTSHLPEGVGSDNFADHTLVRRCSLSIAVILGSSTWPLLRDCSGIYMP